MANAVSGSGHWGATALRAGSWLLLGSWVGGWLLFGAVVTPVVFGSLPRGESGAVVGPVLRVLHYYGAAAGLGLALLALALGRRRWLVGLPLVLAGLCLASQLLVTPRIEAVREQSSAEMAQRFGQLHRLSLRLFVGVGLGTLVLLVGHARAEALASARGGSTAGPASLG